ncbi:MAG: UDP-N-acetylmuramate dehydrogenase [Oscillospiraceae bacterium]|nr:UDP-N-acetylmuramate dehydrogenase [Oscillospiraceae bacterium]
MSKITDFIAYFGENHPELELKTNQPMSKFTSFRIGGAAELMAFPQNEEELALILKMSKKMDIEPVILGAGTNVLAPDAGIPGLVICLKDALSGMEQIGDTQIRVMAGVTMSRAAVFAANLGLSGLEFAHGIPGTVGGGVYMNAGAYGGEIKDVCTRVRIMDMDGNARWITNSEAGFSYRHSAMEDNPWIVAAAEFQLTPAPAQLIKDKMLELINKRRASQPLDLPSAGSAFKRPVGGYAAALIDQTGLKGFRIGGAAVSEKHAGFVVNVGQATAEDVKQLLREVSDRVYAAHGIRLEPEVRIW